MLGTRAARHRARVEHDRGPAPLVQAGEGVLEPRPIALAAGRAAARAETVERVVGEQGGAERLVPHRVGDHDVVPGDAAGRGLELRVEHGVAARDFDLHVVDDGVHVGHGVAFGLQLLAAQLERHAARGVEFAGDEL